MEEEAGVEEEGRVFPYGLFGLCQNWRGLPLSEFDSRFFFGIIMYKLFVVLEQRCKRRFSLACVLYACCISSSHRSK